MYSEQMVEFSICFWGLIKSGTEDELTHDRFWKIFLTTIEFVSPVKGSKFSENGVI